MNEITKQCTKCREFKETNTTNFCTDKRSLDKLSSRCRFCCNLANSNSKRKYRQDISREASRKRHQLQTKRWKELNSNQVRKSWKEWHLSSQYNLSIDKVSMMLEQQNYLCKICFSVLTMETKYVDHNHKTNQIRGLLCSNCNFLLGQAKESKEILINAVNYLIEFDS